MYWLVRLKGWNRVLVVPNRFFFRHTYMLVSIEYCAKVLHNIEFVPKMDIDLLARIYHFPYRDLDVTQDRNICSQLASLFVSFSKYMVSFISNVVKLMKDRTLILELLMLWTTRLKMTMSSKSLWPVTQPRPLTLQPSFWAKRTTRDGFQNMDVPYSVTMTTECSLGLIQFKSWGSISTHFIHILARNPMRSTQRHHHLSAYRLGVYLVKRKLPIYLTSLKLWEVKLEPVLVISDLLLAGVKGISSRLQW